MEAKERKGEKDPCPLKIQEHIKVKGGGHTEEGTKYPPKINKKAYRRWRGEETLEREQKKKTEEMTGRGEN